VAGLDASCDLQFTGHAGTRLDPLLQRVEASLPAANPLVGGQPVLEEVQGPPGLVRSGSSDFMPPAASRNRGRTRLS
jgi:hypothetical protein